MSIVYAQTPLRTTIHKQALQGLYQQLTVDRQRNTISQEKLDELRKLKRQKWDRARFADITGQQVEMQQLALAVAQADFVNATQAVNDASQKLRDVKKSISQLENKLRDSEIEVLDTKRDVPDIAKLEADIKYFNSYYVIQSKRIEELKQVKTLAGKIVNVEEDIYKRLKTLYYQHQNNLREEALVKLTAKVQQERKRWLEKIQFYDEQLQSFDLEERNRHPQAIHLGTNIFQAEEEIYLSDLKLNLARLKGRIEDLSVVPGQDLPIPELDGYLNSVDNILLRFRSIDAGIQAKQDLIQKKSAILKQSRSQKVITMKDFRENHEVLIELQKKYQAKAQLVAAFTKQLKEYQGKIKKDLTKTIAKPKRLLLAFDRHSIKMLGHQLVHIPKSLNNLLITLKDHIFVGVTSLSLLWLGILILVEFLWVSFLFLAHYSLKSLLTAIAKNRERLSVNIAFTLLQFLKKNLIGLVIAGMFITFLLFIGVPFKFYQFLFYLILVWFTFRFIIGVARLFLLETMTNVSGHDVKLYHRLKWAFLFGGVITGLTVLVHQLNVSYEVLALFNRFFMLFLLILAIILFKGRKVVPRLLELKTVIKKLYLKRAVNLLFTLIPLTIFSNAVVGLLGYVELSWILSYYQAVVLLVLILYVIVRGVLIDLIELMADLSIRYLKNGWLWTQAFLKPLDRILRIGVFLGAIAISFISFGWDKQSIVVLKLNLILHYSLFTFAGGRITLLTIIEFIVLVAIIFWAARWTREFAYRWLFRKIRDQGIRNSLSVFSQYFTVFVGVIITLRVLGIDFSGLSFILGGLAVGLGFGLRDFANNIISGIMLLIERPVREGDLISIGAYEGEVTHIGLRSMTVKSWDYMEVMIPNSETFNKSFTNWTHQDSIVRTVIPIKIHRTDDPLFIQKIILEELGKMSGILSEPESQVYLKTLDDVLVEFEVRYFINLEQHSRVEMRSNVLFAIWERFKKEGIHPPYPQQDIHLVKDDE